MLDTNAQSSDSWHEHRKYLKSIATAQLASIYHSKLDPSDVVQKSLLLAYASKSQFRGTNAKEKRGWLRKILLRTIYRSIRDLKARCRDHKREMSFDPSGAVPCLSFDLLHTDRSSLPSEVVRKKELASFLSDAIQRLPEHEQQALLLRYWHYMSLHAIALEMETTIPAVAGLLHRSIKKLKRQLKHFDLSESR
ncbi:sigma-70 family RNA polymerase sigma factor [Pirellulaceae bacterium SH501]